MIKKNSAAPKCHGGLVSLKRSSCNPQNAKKIRKDRALLLLFSHFVTLSEYGTTYMTSISLKHHETTIESCLYISFFYKQKK